VAEIELDIPEGYPFGQKGADQPQIKLRECNVDG
jgi:hypothetical protein